jgi:hypothetical protein
LYTIYESVSLVGHKSNVLNRYVLYTEELDGGYGDVVCNLTNDIHKT